MTQKEIKLAGKNVRMAYCYATEIGFKDLAGQDIGEFVAEVCNTGLVEPDPKKLVYLILSAIMAYYQSRDEEPPVKDRTLLYECEPKEIVAAFTEVLKLRAEWYRVPEGEPKAEEEDPKNA